MPNFIALGQTMYEKSITIFYTLQYFGAPCTKVHQPGWWRIARPPLSSCQILSRSENPFTRYLMPKFVDFVDGVTYHVHIMSHWNSIFNIISSTTLPPPFNGLFSRTTWLSRHEKGKPFWILLEQEIVRWQWHQLDHMQIICTSLQTDNHVSTSPLRFLQAGCPSWHPTNSVQALKAYYIYHFCYTPCDSVIT